MAHAYVRYLGDLSGGQMMGRSVAKTYEAGEAGTNFYNFRDVADVNGRKNAYRAALTALPLTPKEQDEVVGEAIAGFDYAKRMFEDLDKAYPTGERVRGNGDSVRRNRNCGNRFFVPPYAVAVPPHAVPSMASLFDEIRAALRGTDTDYTEGPLRRAIILLAVPMVLEMVMESLFAVVNIFWIAKLGADSVASVGLTESVLSVIYALAMGLSIGVTAMVSRRIGEKNQDAAARVTVQAILLGLAVATVLGTSGFLFAPHLLGLMGATPEVIAAGTGYARIILGGDATVILLFLINAAFRGAGDATIAMRVLWTANAINLLLDPFLIFGWGPFPELGVTGAAVATTIARGSGVLIQLAVLASGTGRLGVARRHVVADFRLMWALIRLSAVGTFQMIVGMVSWIGLVRILSTFGSAALAGYTIAIRVVIFALLPSWGLSNAAATMVGQGLGAKKPDRAEQAVWTAANYNAVFLTIVGVIFFVGSELPGGTVHRTTPMSSPTRSRASGS